MTTVSIIGTGMAGCGAIHKATELGVGTITYDMHTHVGGHTASFQFDSGFTIDEGPHVSFTKIERIQDILAECVKGEYFEHKTKVNNHWKGHWIKHPAQINLHGLPPDLIAKCIEDFVAASHAPEPKINNYEDWLLGAFGETFARTFPMEYTKKYHTTSADNMSTDWVGPRLYRPELKEVLGGALNPKSDDVHYIGGFRYPKRGGFAAYVQPFMEKTDLRLGHKMVGIDPKQKTIEFANGKVEPYEHLVSSVPLPELIPAIKDTPPDVLDAAARLTCSEVVIVSVGIDRADIIDAHWTYFYDEDYFFTRLSTPHLQSKLNVPEGCGSIQAECYYSKKYRPLDRTPDACIEPVIADLRRCGLIKDTDKIMFTHAMYIPYANVIFDLERKASVKTVHGYLKDVGIQYCGRYGDWAYIWTDQSFVSGEHAVQRAIG
ncbi:MAG: NAD(P)-binding protein [Polyangiales bacterium]